VASVDYRNDVVLTPNLLQQVGESYRKIRNTIRFLLGNLHDFNAAEHPLTTAALTDLDRWALAKTQDYIGKLRTAYDSYEFHAAYHATLEFCGGVLSAVYLDVLKDRLYCNDPADPARRASQAVIYEVLRALVVGISPILSFTAEEAWAAMPRRAGEQDSVFFADFPAADPSLAIVPAGFLRLLEKRGEVQEQIEARRPKKKGEREPGQIGSSQEAVVTLTIPAEEAATYAARAEELAELFIVSEVKVELGSWAVSVDTATTHRCARCWNHRESVGSRAVFPDLCGRCADVVEAHPELIPAPSAEP
jgi:isoleucyl-tRNA synthetase